MSIFTFDIPRLETERLIMRLPVLADLEPFAAFYASDRAKFVGGPLDREGSWRMLAMEIGHWQMAGFGRWTVETRDTGAVIGMVGLFGPEGWPEPEIGWDLFAGHEGKGYATEAGAAARAFAYDTLGWDTAISLVKPANTGSARVAQRLGAWHESMYQHPRHGNVQVWRHPGPDALPDGGMEAYA